MGRLQRTPSFESLVSFLAVLMLVAALRAEHHRTRLFPYPTPIVPDTTQVTALPDTAQEPMRV